MSKKSLQKIIMKKLPSKYQWLLNESGPKMLLEFLKIFGVEETPGTGDNPVIMEWAKELGLKNYTADSIAWCGLEMAIIAKRAGKEVVKDPLWALNWKNFGTPVPISEAKLGDVLVFSRRPKGGHVALYVAEDSKCFHSAGGNTSDMSNIARIEKSRCVAVRRPTYSIIPSNVRKIIMGESGPISTNEA